MNANSHDHFGDALSDSEENSNNDVTEPEYQEHFESDNASEKKGLKKFSANQLVFAGIAIVFVIFFFYNKYIKGGVSTRVDYEEVQAVSKKADPGEFPRFGERVAEPVEPLRGEDDPFLIGRTDNEQAPVQPSQIQPAEPIFEPELAVAPVTDPQKDQEIATLKAQMAERDKLITDLSEKLAAEQKKPGTKPVVAAQKVVKKVIPHTPKNSQKRDEELIGFRIRQIIPGQAWLEDSNGKMTVVNVGDQLGVSTVTRIDVDQYRVITTAGTVK